MDFNLVQLAISVHTDRPERLLPHLLLMGGSFATGCRDLVCSHPARVCDSCSQQDACPWYQVFGQKLTTDPAELKRHQKPPLPFIFSFPHDATSERSSTEVQCGLVVVGPAVTHLGMLLDGFADFLASDSCPTTAKVTFVGSRDYQGAIQPLGGDDIGGTQNLVVLSAAGLLEARVWDCTPLHIRILSPLRLLDNGRLLDHFDFNRFARSLMRRVSSMAYYYGACEGDVDFKTLSRQVETVRCVVDHFYIQTGAGRKASGVSGCGSFQGDFSGLMPFLILGSYLHAGKGASYGMGAYELSSGAEDEPD